MSARRLLSSLALLLWLAGCATALPPPREAIPANAQRAVDLLETRWRAFDDLRTLAAVTVDRQGTRQQLSGVLLARRPSAVRFEALSPFGAPFLLLTVADGQLKAYNAATNEAMVGPATAEVTAKLLSLPFDPDDLVSVLVGLASPPADLRAAEVLPADDEGPSVMLYGAVNRKRVWMDMATGVVQQQEIVGGRYAVRVTYLRDPDGQIERLHVRPRPIRWSRVPSSTGSPSSAVASTPNASPSPSPAAPASRPWIEMGWPRRPPHAPPRSGTPRGTRGGPRDYACFWGASKGPSITPRRALGWPWTRRTTWSCVRVRGWRGLDLRGHPSD